MSPSSLLNRNVTVAGRRTSMKLEPEMWQALDEVCRREQLNIHEVCTMIAEKHRGNNLTAAMRVFILSYFWSAATDLGHIQAGHGVVVTSSIPATRLGGSPRRMQQIAASHS